MLDPARESIQLYHMTYKYLKDAILKTLEDLHVPSTYLEVYNHLAANNYYVFVNGKTPENTVSAQLGNFIRDNDTRVRRVKRPGVTYAYYLTKHEEELGIHSITGDPESPLEVAESETITYKSRPYHERDLHILLSSFLNSTKVFSKTIFHEQSSWQDNNQIWTHPDIVGVEFFRLASKASMELLKTIKGKDSFRISSYELKKSINNDNELKKAYFQAVSNSSWANCGYLVAFEINNSLYEELARLNQSFGIGVILLNANPFSSTLLFPSAVRELDFRTMDKLCKNNKEFEQFMEKTANIVNAEDRYHNALMKELEGFCDKYFSSDSEVVQYCNEKNIPLTSIKEASQETA